MAAEMLKPAEAAVVARVTVRDIHRAIDERILPESFFMLDDGRRVAVVACTLIAFYFDSAKRLTAEERLLAIREVGPRLNAVPAKGSRALAEKNWIVRHDFLTIDLSPFVRRTSERFERLTAARNLVTSDPEILGGTPVIRGTRIPVHDVAASSSAGIPDARLLEAYPALDAEKIELATIYAEANPMRGRPPAADELPDGAVVTADRRVPRRKSG